MTQPRKRRTRLPEQLAPPTAAAAPVLRVGTVLASPAATAETCWVDIFGEPIELDYLSPYVPIPGDQVQVLLQSASGTMTGVVLGGLSGRSANRVVNGDFRAHPQPDVLTSRLPYTWGQVLISGGAAVVGMYMQTDYQRALAFIGRSVASASDNLVYSAAFPVNEGETLYLDACTDARGMAATLTVTFRVAFYTEPTVDWNTDSFSDTLIYTDSGAAAFTTWATGNIVVPTGAMYARFAIRAACASVFTLLVGAVEAHH